VHACGAFSRQPESGYDAAPLACPPGSECVLALHRAGAEPLVPAVEVEAPVFADAAVTDHGAEGEDGLGSARSPSCPGNAEPAADEVAAGSFYHPGGDRPARCEGLAVAQELPLAHDAQRIPSLVTDLRAIAQQPAVEKGRLQRLLGSARELAVATAAVPLGAGLLALIEQAMHALGLG
jgi:hypothetical protein